MRFSLLCTLLLVFIVQAGAMAQKITVRIDSGTLDNAFRQIIKQSDVQLVYNTDVASRIPCKAVEFENADVSEILSGLLTGTPLAFRVENGIFIINEKQPERALPQEVEELRITGTVKDNLGHVLPGVTVLVKGTTIGVATDVDGKYELSVPAGNHVLLFSMVGMETQEVKVGTRTEINVVMKEDATELEDVVVTGIFNKPRESYTGAVTTVTEKELKMFKGQNVLQTLGNIDPAFNIVQNNALGSNPNALPEVNIRGNASLPGSLNELNQNVQSQLNTPLIIMDGFEITLQKLMDFNDEEILSINLLKDAAATAIYGSRGANGVIVVTTKKPEAGKLKVFAKAGVSLEIPDLTSYDLLNAREKLELEKELGFYDFGGDIMGNADLYSSILKDVLEGVDTYWLSQPLRTGVGQTYNLRLEGGSEEFRWSGTMGYRETIGVMKNSYRKVLDGTLNLSYSLKNLLFQNQLSVSSTKSQESNYGTFSDYAKMNPYWKPYDEKGNPVKSYRGNPVEGTAETPNPLYDASLNQKNDSKETQIINNFSLEWTITSGLLLRAQIGISKTLGRKDKFYPAEHSKFKDYSEEDYFRKGSYDYNIDERLVLDGNATLNYSHTFNKKHSLYVGLNYSINQSDYFGYGFSAEGFLDENFDFLGNAIAYAQNGKPAASEDISRRVGFTGNANYTYDNRYFVDLSYRLDGGSQFGADKKFAPFWSAGIGWNVHKEHFMERYQHTINNLRLKASIGEIGSQQFSPYDALAMYSYSSSDRYGLWSGASLSGLGNPDLTWQSTWTFNGGFELGLFNNRLTAFLDVYTKKTTNLVSNIALPLATGFSSYAANIGTVRNKGFEAILGGYIIRNTEKEMMWSVTGKIAYNKNEILKLSEAIKQQTEKANAQNVQQVNLLYEGHSVTSIYAVPSLGIDPSCGDEIFLDKDNNRTYKWNANSRRLVGDSEPKYRGNISSLFQWKDLTFNMSFAYHWGGQQYNNTILERVEVDRGQVFYNVDRRVYTGRWRKPGDIVPFKKISYDPTYWSSRFVQDDNMFQLQNVSLSYRLDNAWIQKNLGMQSMTFTANMNDLFYISTIKRERGTSYPFARQMSFNVSFVF